VACMVVTVGQTSSANAQASAQPALDLRVHHAPVRLKMRRAQPKLLAVGVQPRTVASAQAAEASPASTVATDAIPAGRTLRERITFRVNAGVNLETASTSGTLLRGGYALDDSYAASRPWIVGDAMLGSKDVLLPSMNAYLLSSFQFDASRSNNSALPTPVDAEDQQVQIRAGYVEWGRDDRTTGLRNQLWLRGGRQFRQNGGAMFAYFDGATIGWRTPSVQVTGFVGQRVAMYIDSLRGVSFGGAVQADLKQSRGWPATVAMDYQGLAIDGALRSLISARSEITLGKKATLNVRARVVGTDGDLVLGRLGGRLNYTVNRKLLIVADLENRAGGDLAYDLTAPSAVDVVDVARRLGVGLSAPVDALTVGARADFRAGVREYIGFVRAELPRGEVVQADRVGFVEVGTAVASVIGARTWANLQYLTRQRSLDDNANLVGGGFADTSGAGISSLHELAVDAVWRGPTGKNGRKWRLSGGGFYRVYSGQTAYAQFENDGRGGARADAQFWINRQWHLMFGGEFAQASPTMSRDLSSITSVRVGAEAMF
ncbi:MAG: hypothetical protein KBG15_24180, partial [Kofleriaceae bacterium]|nr:hypothetical protein [Kofleriaceae bacterium]